MKMKLKDTDGVESTQQVVSSVVNNYVTYHVTKASQQMWILDDFQQVRQFERHRLTVSARLVDLSLIHI